MKKNYGWVICFSCALLLFCTGGLTGAGFSAYQPYLISVGGLTNTQASAVVMFKNLFGCLGMLTVNSLIRKFGARNVALMGMISCGAGFLVYGSAVNFTGYLVAAALTGTAMGIGGMIMGSLIIARWFNDHRGLALGICMAATGLSTIVASPLITLLVIHSSLTTAFRTEAVFIFAAAAVVFLTLRSKPDGKKTFPIGSECVQNARVYAHHKAPKRLKIILMIGIFLFGMPGNALYSHLSVLYSSSGFEPMQVSMQLSLFGIMLMVGKCIYGQVADRFGTFRSSWVFYTMTAIGTALCCLAGNHSYVISLMASGLIGLGLAVTTVSIPMYATRVATEREYTGIVSQYQMLSTLGALVFGTVPGMIADRTGSYVPTYVLMLVIAVAASLMMQISYHKIRVIDVAADRKAAYRKDVS